MAENEGHEGLWLEDAPSAAPHSSSPRRIWVLVASMACIAALAIPVALAFSSNGPSPKRAQAAPHLTRGVAEQNVLSALSATTSSGSFNVSYEFDPATQPTVTTTTTTAMPTCHVVILAPSNGLSTSVQGASVSPAPSEEECAGSVSGTSTPGSGSPTTGHGTIDTDPFAMVAVSNVPGLGEITLRDNGTNVWEFGGADYGLSPGSSESGPGASLTGFASLVEGTLGARQGALAMGGLSSPTGYLDLDQSMITGADQTGTSTVDGVPVTVYQISIDPAQDANVPGVNAEEAEAIKDSSAILQQQDYTGSTVQVSIDASGYIRETHSVAHFSDGSTTTSWSTFSDFGCAGTVLMPGQTGPTAPPAGCVSPDTGVAPTTTTTSTLAPPTLSPATVPSTVPSTARSTVPTTVLLPTTSTTMTEPPSTSTSTTNTTSSTSTTVPRGVTTTSG
jgi:hypothetical protein